MRVIVVLLVGRTSYTDVAKMMEVRILMSDPVYLSGGSSCRSNPSIMYRVDSVVEATMRHCSSRTDDRVVPITWQLHLSWSSIKPHEPIATKSEARLAQPLRDTRFPSF